ncbi:nucleotidyltransferase domain-containing protein [Treponema sp.]
MKYGIPEQKLEKIITTITTKTGIDSIILYGSRAKGTERPGSDIDLCLVAPNLDFSALARIENAELIDHINRWGIVLYTKAN